ncbi:S-adenosyl-L-methionine-dependent methyltransferase [Lipomyces japonicus]|uniref:S-adenosyl-L-methionine-dependent methyltransferase n=1 Tax=Lipomyces japonicus TaxID=56871 RepID=UPI0034CDFA17
MSGTSTPSSFVFIKTPPASPPPPADLVGNGVHSTAYPAIKNAPLPADGPGSKNFSNLGLAIVLFGVPFLVTRKLNGGLKTFFFFFIVFFAPLLASYWIVVSAVSPRLNQKVQYPGKPVEHYLEFHDPALKNKYTGDNKIPIETFYELYFDGKVSFKGDALDVLEYRHDWASFRFTIGLCKYFITGMIPEVIFHTRSQDEEQVRGHYDRGDDFYGWFLGPRMIYTSGIISDINKEETLEELQDNKLRIICEKLQLKKGEKLLDLGCGWGTLAKFASSQYDAHVTGITLGRNQTKWGNQGLQDIGISQDQSRILCLDYRDTPLPTDGSKYDKISCLEMAEHVGVRKFGSFLAQVYDMLNDDGIFVLQIAGLRKSWQYEDLIWGLFMNKYVFPGADASTPLGFVIDKLEGAGFEVSSVDTIGVHYSATLWKWYRNWIGNADKVEAKYGKRWFRIWEYFLASSVITSRQGGATCFQIVLRKNLNSYHRIENVPFQYGLHVPQPSTGNTWLKE